MKNIFEYNLKKTGWDIFSKKWYFLVCWGPLQRCIDGNQFVRLVLFVFIYLRPPALYTFLSITSSPPSLQNPDYVSFSRKLYYLYLALIPLGSPVFTGCYRFFWFVFMCLFFLLASCEDILGTGTKMEQLGSSCSSIGPHVLELVSGCSPTLMGSWRTLSRVLINCLSFD